MCSNHCSNHVHTLGDHTIVDSQIKLETKNHSLLEKAILDRLNTIELCKDNIISHTATL
jgi:hypothetical protein